MGKSATGEILRRRSVPVVDTDVLAREVVERGQPALDQIISVFGSDILDGEGRLNRGEVARRVFGNPPLREKLEATLHPPIRERWRTQMDSWRGQGHPVAAVIIPLLFEIRAEKECDFTVCVACLPQTQQKRLL